MPTDVRILLVLWDIDHTLIESRGVGRLIYERIFPEVTGQPLGRLATVDGRTELDIIHDTLELHGILATDDVVGRMASALARGYSAALDELIARGRALPGALTALKRLAQQSGIRQSVLTGNTTEVARIKAEAFGLAEYLDFAAGAYGDDHHDRAELAAIARRRASERLDIAIEPHEVVIIGDTPNDIAAAVATGGQSIGVATGKYTTADLAAAGAAKTLDSLQDFTALHEALAEFATSSNRAPNPGDRRTH